MKHGYISGGEKSLKKKHKTSRITWLGLLFLGMCAILLGRFFYLQVLHGADYLQSHQDQIERAEVIEAGRGNIYDRNGVPLAYNELSYSVTIEDNNFYASQTERSQILNQMISKTIALIEEKGDDVESVLPIEYSALGSYSFTLEDSRLQRFRADIYGHSSMDELTYNEALGYDEKEATAEQIMEYLCSDERFSIRDDYPRQQALKVASIRYAMSLNAYQRYVPTVIAHDVNEETVAAIYENEADLNGVDIKEEQVRRYKDSYYFSHIMGYTGQISEEEMEELSKDGLKYDRTDVVGKAGIEQVMESQLQGVKGSRRFYVDNVGRVTQDLNTSAPVLGNDVYLTLDANLQRVVYNLLEQRLAGLLYSNLIPGDMPEDEAGNADDVRITSDQLYFALIDNHMLDTERLTREGAGDTEKRIAGLAEELDRDILTQLGEAYRIPYHQLSYNMQRTMDYITELLNQEEVFLLTEEVLEDESYRSWQNGYLSFEDFLKTAVEKGWFAVEKLDFEDDFVLADSMIPLLEARITEGISENDTFQELIFELLIRSKRISGEDICMALYEQGTFSEEEGYAQLVSGEISAYDLLREKIRTLSITPAQLALDPCTASSVVVDPDSGEVLACVTYPGYDNNRLANTIDEDYYNRLLRDASLPLYNNATQQRTAPGSTFKPITAAAGLSAGVITTDSAITDLGRYETISPSPECWIYPNDTHGTINVSQAIRDSCNYFFYETAFRLSDGREEDGRTIFDEEKGISTLTQQAENFGLGETSGIQLPESEPRLADEYPIMAAIGQSNFAFTTTQLVRYTSAIANQGSVYALNLIDHVERPDKELISRQEPTLVKNVEGVGDASWNAIRTGMEMMAEESGYFQGMPVSIAGKTGTAEQTSERPNHALFVGYAPVDSPEIAIATRIAYGYASSNAAEVSADIFRYYFGAGSEQELINHTADEVGITGNITGD